MGSAIVKTAGSIELAFDSSDATKRTVNNNNLFPHPPRKASSADWAIRKPSNQTRHSSDIPRVQHTIRPFNNASATTSARIPVKAKGPALKQPERARENIKIAVQRAASRNSSYDSNRSALVIPPRRQLINRLANVPTRTDASTQTEPCKCQVRMRAKNRNRRENAKANRELVRSLQLNQAKSNV